MLLIAYVASFGLKNALRRASISCRRCPVTENCSCGRRNLIMASHNDLSVTSACGRRRTAAGLIIGNEILNGKTLDTNTQTLAQILFTRGITLALCETIPDDFTTIRTAVSRLAAAHDYVFTSGGIGPTLDDITYQSVAAAFGTELAIHEETVARMRAISPHMEMNKARMRMATLPVGCETLWTDGLWVPTVCLAGKVYVLPGVPRLFSSMLKAIPEDRVSGGGMGAKAIAFIDTNLAEGDIADSLDKIAQQFPKVSLGSYPADPVAKPDVKYRTRLAVEADDAADVREAVDALQRATMAIETIQAGRRGLPASGNN